MVIFVMCNQVVDVSEYTSAIDCPVRKPEWFLKQSIILDSLLFFSLCQGYHINIMFCQVSLDYLCVRDYWSVHLLLLMIYRRNIAT